MWECLSVVQHKQKGASCCWQRKKSLPSLMWLAIPGRSNEARIGFKTCRDQYKYLHPTGGCPRHPALAEVDRTFPQILGTAMPGSHTFLGSSLSRRDKAARSLDRSDSTASSSSLSSPWQDRQGQVSLTVLSLAGSVGACRGVQECLPKLRLPSHALQSPLAVKSRHLLQPLLSRLPPPLSSRMSKLMRQAWQRFPQYDWPVVLPPFWASQEAVEARAS